MSAVTDMVVREYFEEIGFLVSQPRKAVMMRRKRRAIEEVDILVLNPRATEHVIPEHLIWNREDFTGIRAAVIGITGWHTERLYASTFEQSPELLRFMEPDVMKAAERTLGTGTIAKVLCVPGLPASGDLKTRSLEFLRERGLDGVLPFRTVLAELVGRVDKSVHYEKSDLLQVIRLLKNYGFIMDGQLDLFEKRPPRRG